MIDFKELGKDGTKFEILIREIFIKLNFEVKWSGVGPDRGKDLIVTENHKSLIGNTKTKWLVQCKHNANSEKSVGIDDLGDFVSACHDHDVDHYLLVCSTQVSSSLIERFENISLNKKIVIDYWDATKIEKILSSVEVFDIAQMFFPGSSKSTKIKIFATEMPNEWIFIYKGYYILLENRIMSSYLQWSHKEIKSIISEIKNIEKNHLTKNEMLLPRKIWFNGKSPEFVWYIDYLYDNYSMKNKRISLSSDRLKYLLEDGFARSDGNIYFFDVNIVPASFSSDHFHENHYDYYEIVSKIRGQDFSFNKKVYKEIFESLNSKIEDHTTKIAETLRRNNFKVLNIKEDCTKEIFNLSISVSWQDIFYEKNIDSSSDFFGPRLIISTDNDEKLLTFLSGMLSRVEEDHVFFDLMKRYIYSDELEADEYTFDLKFKVLFARNYLDYLIKLEAYLGQFSEILFTKSA